MMRMQSFERLMSPNSSTWLKGRKLISGEQTNHIGWEP
jgi:hypothetical protein